MVIFPQNPSYHIKNIGFVSTRIAGTDGVSLEIQKWAEVLERNRYECFYFAGELDRAKEKSLLVEEAYFDHPLIQEINDEVFGKRSRKRETSGAVQEIKNRLKAALYEFAEQFDIHLIIPENALSIPMNIPLGIALSEFIAETGIPTIAHHHDFFWERPRFLINACMDYLNMAFPPYLPSIKHVVINSLASEQLSFRRGISNSIVPNVLDFANEPPPLDDYCTDLRERIGLHDGDLFILQPTRVVPRKWIERSIEIVRNLNLSNPVLVISHALDDEGTDYYLRVRDYSESMGVKLLTIDHLISSMRCLGADGGKLYRTADLYQNADLVTYPSGYEGFGNAFLETIYYRKPIVVNRYSIYIADIEPVGFDVIVLDGFVSSQVIAGITNVLNNDDRRQAMVEHNYQIGKRYFSYEVLEEKLMHLIRTFE
ncbi:MAG: glycosyltransferase family 1 protein [Deltaproteobacteria bacterium]|nr:glycosyltransferase family 4 protein [Deltaproteobacteria bacterium]MBW2076173.1 glycosyltransferase family 4 protein [Deltaproteobacteria bacterium]MBW2310397.1 glycosyltransferase family 4 protein [Deltaproteobacteria bacterium]RLB31112.1 MAG: glycosyltransferase family 1 protein [Deltaproteobacteria bacterium]